MMYISVGKIFPEEENGIWAYKMRIQCRHGKELD